MTAFPDEGARQDDLLRILGFRKDSGLEDLDDPTRIVTAVGVERTLDLEIDGLSPRTGRGPFLEGEPVVEPISCG